MRMKKAFLIVLGVICLSMLNSPVAAIPLLNDFLPYVDTALKYFKGVAFEIIDLNTLQKILEAIL